MKCAIIGGNGYVGRHMYHYLTKIGITPVVYDYKPNINSIHIDITSVESLRKIDLNVDLIFMFAGITGTISGFSNYKLFNSINEIGLLNLLDTIAKSQYRPKIVFPSTRLVYKGSDKALKEDDEKETKTIYAVNKLACEGLLQAYYYSFNIPYIVFRICVPYGNLLSIDYSYGTIGFFINQCQKGYDISLYGGGDIKRTFTHIEDICYQMFNGSMIDNTNNSIYNIGGETLSLKSAAYLVAKRYNLKVKEIPWPEEDLKIESGHSYFDDTKINNLLGKIKYKRLIDYISVI